MYFPVEAKPLEMKASLISHPADFGNGGFDNLYFQFDENQKHYLEKKRLTDVSRFGSIETDRSLHSSVVAWCKKTLISEHNAYWGGINDYLSLAYRVQEDFAVISGDDKIVAIYVAFPSNWNPKNILGSSFSSLHAPVPGFPRNLKVSSALVDAMVNKGPYVRFVWTISPDLSLDHHPDSLRPSNWVESNAWCLRVERQITVPFKKDYGALFLIRTYLTPFHKLNPSQSAILIKALSLLPEEISSYKGLTRSIIVKAIDLLGKVARSK